MFIAFDLAIPNVTNLDRIKKLKELLAFTTEKLDSSIEIIKTHKIGSDAICQAKTEYNLFFSYIR